MDSATDCLIDKLNKLELQLGHTKYKKYKILTFFLLVKSSSNLEDSLGLNFFEFFTNKLSKCPVWMAFPLRFLEKFEDCGFGVVNRVDLLGEDEMGEVLVVGSAPLLRLGDS